MLQEGDSIDTATGRGKKASRGQRAKGRKATAGRRPAAGQPGKAAQDVLPRAAPGAGQSGFIPLT